VTWDEADVLLYGLDLARWPKEKAAAEREARVAARSMPSETPYEAPDRGWGHAGWPAGSVHVRWARRYCEWLSKKTGARYRLPTEAEWEWACRAGAPRRVALRGAELDAVAWHGGNSAGKDGEREPRPHRVATRRANAWGFHDMLGNVAEWVRRADGTYAVAGGSFEDAAGDVHAGTREAYSERWQRNDPRDPRDVIFLSDGAHVGFRVVREE
jgi:formylglycine-generating enzyme required for sulfatase activity